MKRDRKTNPPEGERADTADSKSEHDRVLDKSPPGTAAGVNTTSVPDQDSINPVQIEQGKKAKADAEGEQEDTDRYNVSGQEHPPKVP